MKLLTDFLMSFLRIFSKNISSIYIPLIYIVKVIVIQCLEDFQKAYLLVHLDRFLSVLRGGDDPALVLLNSS